MISQILVSSICTTPPTYKRKPCIRCQVKIEESKPTPHSHNSDFNQSLLWSWSSSWKILGERKIDSLFGLYERRTSYPRTFNGQNVFQKESGKSAMYAVVNALNEQVGWRVGPLEVKVCYLLNVFQTWCLILVVIRQIHAKSCLFLCFQGSEFVILSNKQRVRPLKVGFMFHLLLSLRLCSIPALTSRLPGKDSALMNMIIFRITWLKASL